MSDKFVNCGGVYCEENLVAPYELMTPAIIVQFIKTVFKSINSNDCY